MTCPNVFDMAMLVVMVTLEPICMAEPTPWATPSRIF